MPFPDLYSRIFVVLPILWFIASMIHGLMKTEAVSLGGWAESLKNFALASLMVSFFMWLLEVVSPLLVSWKLVEYQVANGLTYAIWPWIMWLLIINSVTGVINHLILRSYSLRTWGTTRPLYGNWPEFQTSADRSSGRTTIWFNSDSGSPISTATNPSLRTRAFGRSHRTSFASSSHRTSASYGKSHRTSSKKSSGGGGEGASGAGAGCLALIVRFWNSIANYVRQGVVILLLFASSVFFAWFSYWFTLRVTDWWDELWAIDMVGAGV